MNLSDCADRLGLPLSRIKQLLHDRKLLAVRRPDGTLTLLADCGFDDAEALRWLFTADDSLPGTPIQAMVERRATEVNRRAQALAF